MLVSNIKDLSNSKIINVVDERHDIIKYYINNNNLNVKKKKQNVRVKSCMCNLSYRRS